MILMVVALLLLIVLASVVYMTLTLKKAVPKAYPDERYHAIRSEISQLQASGEAINDQFTQELEALRRGRIREAERQQRERKGN